jgi:hypothetical protein
VEAKPYKIPHPFRRLNKELIDRIVQDIAEGSTHRLAAESNGITTRILEIWRKQGEIDQEHGKYDSLPAYLVRSMGEVKKKEVKWCRNMIKKSKKGHKGAEWTLEHAYQRDYSSNAPLRDFAEEIDELKTNLAQGLNLDKEVNVSAG